MAKTKSKTVLPLPERVITWAAAGAHVTLTAEAARSLASDAIKLREIRDHVTDAAVPVRGTLDCRDWVDWAAVLALLIAATQLVDWGFAVVAWLF